MSYISFSKLRPTATIAYGLLILLGASSAAGAQRRLELKQYKIQPESTRWPEYSVTFLNDETVVAAFVSENARFSLSSRNDPQNGRYQFTSALIDFDSGNVVSSHTWGNAQQADQLLTLDGNRILIATSHRLSVYSPDYEQLLEREVEGGNYPDVHLSADRRYICRDVLDPKTDTLKVRVFTAARFDLTRSLSESGVPVDCDGINLLFWERQGSMQAELRTTRVFVQHEDGPKDELKFSTLKPGEVCKGGMSLYPPKFLSGDRLIAQCGDNLIVSGLSGNVLSEQSLRGRSISGQVTESADGTAIAIGTLQQGAWYDRFHVSDFRLLILDGQSLVERKVIPIDLSGNHKPAFALSPNGKRLAYLTDGRVSLVELNANHH